VGSWSSSVLCSSSTPKRDSIQLGINRNATAERQDMRPILHTASNPVDKYGKGINKDESLQHRLVFFFQIHVVIKKTPVIERGHRSHLPFEQREFSHGE
jgi:hypothetical protein